MTKSRGINRKSHRWTGAQKRLLRREYPNTPTREIAKKLGLSLQQTVSTAMNLGLRKSPAYLASPHACRLRRGDNVGAAHRFEKGHAPANKGLRRPGWYRGRMRQTQFKKGNRPHTWRPIGTEAVNADGYLVRKMTETGPQQHRWKAVHRILWQEAHGKIPPKHAVVFKDGDKTNIKLENLELVTRSELGRRNVMWNRYQKALARTIQLIGALKRQINRRLGRRQGKSYERRNVARSALRNTRLAPGQGCPDGYRPG